MAQNTKWYVDSVGWTAVTAWNQPQTPAAGTLQRQAAAPTVGNERVFVCSVSGAVGAAEPAWTVTKGAKTTDNAATWIEVTGQPGVNGDTANSATWLTNKNAAVAQGLVIFDSVSNSLQVCTTAGNSGNGAQPAFSATAGTTTADNTVTWTSLGLASTFGAWAAPHARLNNTFGSGWTAAGDTVFVASEHAETASAATTTIAPTGTIASPNLIISTNKVVPPTFASGATITSTVNGDITFDRAGCGAYFDGLTFNDNGNAPITLTVGVNAPQWFYFKNCQLKLGTNTASGTIRLNSSTTGQGKIILDNTTLSFANAGQSINTFAGSIEWLNTPSAIQGTAPTTLFAAPANGGPVSVSIHGVDLSAITGNLFTVSSSGVGPLSTIVSNCKLAAGVTINTGTWNSQNISGNSIIINADSGATGFRNEWHNFWGDITTETTITLKNGASDGVQSISHKYIASANPTVTLPLVWPPFDRKFGVWNTTTGKAVTATVQIISSGTLNNNDIWLEIEFLGSAGSPLSSFANSGLANPLSTAVAVTSSTATWNSQPATPVTQQLQVTFTPQMVGYVYGRIYVAKASTTIFVDPEITIK